MTERVFTFGSVCSGIEAASCAWRPLGWRCAFMSEIEPFPRAVLTHHWGDVPLHGDFTTIQAGDYDPIDLLVGGTPCQSFSVAGLRGGLDDERGNLALEYLRLADRLRPRWLVWENVPGVLSSGDGRDFGSILGGLVELGYGFAYRVLDAQFFGVAQRRRRVFVVGHLGDWRRAAAVLFERHGLQGHPAPRREAGKGIAGTLAPGAHPGGFNGRDAERDLLIAHALCAEGFDASEDGSGRGTPLIPVAYQTSGNCGAWETGQVTGALDTNTDPNSHVLCFSSKDHGADAETDLAPTLRAGGHDGSHANAGVPPAIAFALRGRDGGAMPELGGEQVGSLRSASGGSSRDYVAFTQNSRSEVREIGGDGSIVGALAADAGAQQQNYVYGTVRSHTRPGSNEVGSIINTSAVRRLTPVECERLQGFPDKYTLIPWRKGMAPDGPRYKALGNSMAVPVMAWIGRRIAAVEALPREAAA